MFSRKKITQVVLNWLNSSLCRLCNIPDLPADWHLWWMINKWCTLGMLGGSRFTINMLKTGTLEIIVVFIIIFRVMSVQVGRLIDWQIINDRLTCQEQMVLLLPERNQKLNLQQTPWWAGTAPVCLFPSLSGSGSSMKQRWARSFLEQLSFYAGRVVLYLNVCWRGLLCVLQLKCLDVKMFPYLKTVVVSHVAADSSPMLHIVCVSSVLVLLSIIFQSLYSHHKNVWISWSFSCCLNELW